MNKIKTNYSARLLQTRNALKKRKPAFKRQEAPKKMTLEVKWRKPKGMHSKMRRMLRGHPRRVEPGWGSPSSVKFLSKDGLKKVIIANVADLEKLNNETDGAIVASGVGTKKRVEILTKAKQMGIKIINFDADKFMAKFDESQKIKSEKKSKEAKDKAEKQKEKEKKAAEKQKEEKKTQAEEGQISAEAEKEHQKKELDKTLTKKDAA